jgi:hypothetical protein
VYLINLVLHDFELFLHLGNLILTLHLLLAERVSIAPDLLIQSALGLELIGFIGDLCVCVCVYW